MASGISVTEWRQEIERVYRENQQNDEGLTGPEWQEILNEQYGFGRPKAQAFLKRLVKEGVLVAGERVVEKDWDARRRIYTVFRLAGDRK